MYVQFSLTQEPSRTPSVELSCVYRLCADETYHAVKGVSPDRPGYVAVRTTAGRGVLRWDGHEPVVLTEHTLLLVENQKLIEYYPQEDLWEFWWMEFTTADDLPVPLDTLLPFSVSSEEDALWRSCMLSLRGSTRLRQLASCDASSLLVRWARCLEAPTASHHMDRLEKLVQYLHTHSDTAVSLEEMASFCALSQRQFREIFLKTYGVRPSAYALRIRLDRAALFLRNTSVPIADIAEQTGFRDPFYFSRCFSRVFGVSPREYRKGKTEDK